MTYCIIISSFLPHGCISWLTYFLTFLAALNKAVIGSKFMVRRDRSHQLTHSWMSITVMSGKKDQSKRISRNWFLFFFFFLRGSINLGYVYSFQMVVFKLLVLSSYLSYSAKGSDAICSTWQHRVGMPCCLRSCPQTPKTKYKNREDPFWYSKVAFR